MNPAERLLDLLKLTAQRNHESLNKVFKGIRLEPHEVANIKMVYLAQLVALEVTADRLPIFIAILREQVGTGDE